MSTPSEQLYDLSNVSKIKDIKASLRSVYDFLDSRAGESASSTRLKNTNLSAGIATIVDLENAVSDLEQEIVDAAISVKMNGSVVPPSNGIVDLGTVLTAHQSLTGYVPWVEDSDGDKTAVTVGYRIGTVGTRSLANGDMVEASGEYSHAEGSSTEASGFAAHSEGESTEASGGYSHAEGDTTVASGLYSHAEGNSTTASGEASHAEGAYTIAYGSYSHAEGNTTQANGEDSHAEGIITKTNDVGSHAEGYEVYANGPVTHAEGFGYTIPGELHPSGEDTHYGEANGMASHMEGVFGTADGVGSHVEGIFASDDGHTGTFVWQGYMGADLTPEDQEYLWYGSDSGATRQQVISTILARGQYNSHGVGTFNVNPKGGLSGFYIGEQNLASIFSSAGFALTSDLSTKADLTALNELSLDIVDALSNDINPKLSTIADLVSAEVKLVDQKADISSLATVATTGSYNDLLNKPTIPTANDGVLTIKQNGAQLSTFSANQSSNVTVNIKGAYYATCDTARSTAAKVATLKNANETFVLEEGVVVYVKFSNRPAANTSNTLNVANTGAKTIYRGTFFNLDNGSAAAWDGGDVVGFIYDGTYWKLLTPTIGLPGNTGGLVRTFYELRNDSTMVPRGDLFYKASTSIAQLWVNNASTSYSAGDYVMYTDGKLYKAKVDIAANTAWNASNWEAVTVMDELSAASGRDYLPLSGGALSGNLSVEQIFGKNLNPTIINGNTIISDWNEEDYDERMVGHLSVIGNIECLDEWDVKTRYLDADVVYPLRESGILITKPIYVYDSNGNDPDPSEIDYSNGSTFDTTVTINSDLYVSRDFYSDVLTCATGDGNSINASVDDLYVDANGGWITLNGDVEIGDSESSGSQTVSFTTDGEANIPALTGDNITINEISPNDNSFVYFNAAEVRLDDATVSVSYYDRDNNDNVVGARISDIVDAANNFQSKADISAKNFLDYATLTALTLSPTIDVYKMTLTANGVSAAFPEIYPNAIPVRNSYFKFEMEITVPAGVTTITYPNCYEWLNEDDIPDPGLVEGRTMYLAARFDCNANRSNLSGSTLVNVWRIK